jgi:hypothetical protein
MAKGFGEDLWHNAQAVRLDNLGTLKAPVRAHPPATESAARPQNRLAAWLRRLTRRP